MIIYSVTITLHADIEAEWADWMQRVHIPDVLDTGCFVECRMYKVLDPAGSEPGYRLQYQCLSLADYHRYRDNYAPALQKLHTDRYAGKFQGSRHVLEAVAPAIPAPAKA